MNKVQHKNIIIKLGFFIQFSIKIINGFMIRMVMVFGIGIYKFLNVFDMPLMSCFLMTFDS